MYLRSYDLAHDSTPSRTPPCELSLLSWLQDPKHRSWPIVLLACEPCLPSVVCRSLEDAGATRTLEYAGNSSRLACFKVGKYRRNEKGPSWGYGGRGRLRLSTVAMPLKAGETKKSAPLQIVCSHSGLTQPLQVSGSFIHDCWDPAHVRFGVLSRSG